VTLLPGGASFFGRLGNVEVYGYSEGIWRTDGTTVGTAQIFSASTDEFLSGFSIAGNRLYFSDGFGDGQGLVSRADGTANAR